ncbi:hypothetical protein N7507_009377 [Penicillium longicatenatum]|nr:hypothetical protein N7507_009377 [Penicillium longicatenatum]
MPSWICDCSHLTIDDMWTLLDAPIANAMLLCPVIPDQALDEVRVAEYTTLANRGRRRSGSAPNYVAMKRSGYAI